MPNAFDALAKDHAEVKQLLAELERGPVAATGAGPGKVVLDRLDKLAPADEEFEDQLPETVVWPGLRGALTAAEADGLGRELEEGKGSAPRPHPRTPASPGLLKAAGPAVAAADRLRDAVTGRDE
jgi:hypothetical protein